MYQGKKILALIPARSGSKRLPSKNIKPLLGKPLIGWTVEAAKESKYIDRIVVSTDGSDIAEISRKYGAEVPFLRPAEIATDTAKSIDSVLHAIEWLKDNGMYYDLIILLQPTSPLRLSEDIDKAIELLFLKDAQSIVSVCKTRHSGHLINTLQENGSMVNFSKADSLHANRQGPSNFYRINGAIYLTYCDYILRKGTFLGNESFAYVMPEERSVDIDDNMDFMLAEFLIKDRVKPHIP